MKTAGLLFVTLLILSPPAYAGCQSPVTQSEMTHCAGEAFEAADRKLNRAYRTAVSSVKKTDDELPKELKGAEKALRKAQRARIGFRDASCELAGFDGRGGSIESMLISLCLESMTKDRTKELKALATGSNR